MKKEDISDKEIRNFIKELLIDEGKPVQLRKCAKELREVIHDWELTDLGIVFTSLEWFQVRIVKALKDSEFQVIKIEDRRYVVPDLASLVITWVNSKVQC